MNEESFITFPQWSSRKVVVPTYQPKNLKEERGLQEK